MEYKTLANNRYSVRNFTNQPVENEKIELILETARKAPSAVNFQPYKMYVVQSAEKLDAVKSCYHRTWIKSAPIVIVVVGKKGMAWKRAQDMKDYTDIDAAILIDHIMLQATDLGLGTCWVCNFDIDALREVLELDYNQEPIAIIPVGYPASDEIPVKKRKGLDELVVWI